MFKKIQNGWGKKVSVQKVCHSSSRVKFWSPLFPLLLYLIQFKYSAEFHSEKLLTIFDRIMQDKADSPVVSLPRLHLTTSQRISKATHTSLLWTASASSSCSGFIVQQMVCEFGFSSQHSLFHHSWCLQNTNQDDSKLFLTDKQIFYGLFHLWVH